MNVNWSAALVALVPAPNGEVTVISTVPVPAGAIAVSDVGLWYCTERANVLTK
jgi:hypothetical protein